MDLPPGSAHCCKVTRRIRAGVRRPAAVVADEIIRTLHGLQAQRRKAVYGKIDPEEATTISSGRPWSRRIWLPGRPGLRTGRERRRRKRVLSAPWHEAAAALIDFGTQSARAGENRELADPGAPFRHGSRRGAGKILREQIKDVLSLHELNRLLGEAGMVERCA